MKLDDAYFNEKIESLDCEIIQFPSGDAYLRTNMAMAILRQIAADARREQDGLWFDILRRASRCSYEKYRNCVAALKSAQGE